MSTTNTPENELSDLRKAAAELLGSVDAGIGFYNTGRFWRACNDLADAAGLPHINEDF